MPKPALADNTNTCPGYAAALDLLAAAERMLAEEADGVSPWAGMAAASKDRAQAWLVDCARCDGRAPHPPCMKTQETGR